MMSEGTCGKHDECRLTIQLFQGKLFGFSDKGKYHEPCDEVKSSIEADCHLG